ncbi:hypothetical protein [Anaeromyxobacter diazotrophicus]|uniref:Uncharacterized protein n=1 Tax=Anaeromyxobacter diazotrophicus TaxID=2590199 RepID=A0A7I9VMZ9_9BACT|nr:hypothetical protein [Anaeromyxobacter diazotrophicus]GEJ57782.1 hypothetical protein AMYX_25230 [Anaeromyxobacter diazotrophicus]
MSGLLLAWCLLAAAGVAPAEDLPERPSDDEVFGAAPGAPAPADPALPSGADAGPATVTPPAPPSGAVDGMTAAERAELAAARAEAAAVRAEAAGAAGAGVVQAAARVPAAPPPALAPPLSSRSETLQVGGLSYLQAVVSGRQGQPPGQYALSAPFLTDAYLDARPNDRVRAYVVGRFLYDPTVSAIAPNTIVAARTQHEQVLLDQAWINFDIERAVFVTIGKQHVKWGVGHFWNPTDYLHSQHLDPLALYDARTGTSMVKLNVPWEKTGWNFYAMGVLEGDQAAEQVQKVGGAARAELVLGRAELGLDGIVEKGFDPRFGVDLSVGLGELDVYAEAALRWGSLNPRYTYGPNFSADPLSVVKSQPSGFRPAVTGGVSWEHRWTDRTVTTFGVEYAYDANGYDDPALYPGLLANAAFTPFYVGRHYAGAYLAVPRLGAWRDAGLTLSTVGNLSRRSAIVRLDFSLLMLTHLRMEAWVAGHAGPPDGEFRLGLDVPPHPVGDGTFTPAFRQGPQVVDLGLAFRVAL